MIGRGHRFRPRRRSIRAVQAIATSANPAQRLSARALRALYERRGAELAPAATAAAGQRGTGGISLLYQASSSPTLPAARGRASLDENAWSQLRLSCPARSGDHEIDVKVAKRLLADPYGVHQRNDLTP